MPYKTTTVDPALLVLKPTFVEIEEVELRHHLVGLSRAHPLACVHVYICVGFCIGRMWGLVNVLDEDPNDLMQSNLAACLPEIRRLWSVHDNHII